VVVWTKLSKYGMFATGQEISIIKGNNFSKYNFQDIKAIDSSKSSNLLLKEYVKF
jgi:hypothetical protein